MASIIYTLIGAGLSLVGVFAFGFLWATKKYAKEQGRKEVEDKRIKDILDAKDTQVKVFTAPERDHVTIARRMSKRAK